MGCCIDLLIAVKQPFIAVLQAFVFAQEKEGKLDFSQRQWSTTEGRKAALETGDSIKRVKLVVDQRLLSLTMRCDGSLG